MSMPAVRSGDNEAFDQFFLLVHSLVGMLRSLEGQNGCELKCGSHVDRLIGKLPAGYRDRFVEHCINRGILQADSDQTYTLSHLVDWLQVKSRAKRIAGQAVSIYDTRSRQDKRDGSSKQKTRPTSALMTVEEGEQISSKSKTGSNKQKNRPNRLPSTLHCTCQDHRPGLVEM